MMHSRSKFVKEKGFTLIELLIITAIISILAAILFPVFARARENALRATCQSNLEQIGLGIRLYAQDYDGRYAPVQWSGISGTSPGNWSQLIQPYVKSTELFRCPSNPNNTAVKSRAGTFAGIQYPLINRSYGQNRPGPRTQSQVQSPAQKIQVSEDNSEWDLEPRDGGSFQNRHFAGHFGTANYLYYDGHVKAQRPVETGTPFNQWGRGEGAECDTWFQLANAINCDIVQPALVARLNYVTEKYK